MKKNINKNWNRKNKKHSKLTPLEKMILLPIWIKEWCKVLNIKLSEEEIDIIYYNNIDNIDNIYFPNTEIIVREYIEKIF